MNKLNEEILAKFLMGECTEDELREVNAWLEGSGENARELFRLEEIYHLGRLGDTSNTQDIEKAEKRLFKKAGTREDETIQGTEDGWVDAVCGRICGLLPFGNFRLSFLSDL